MKDNVIKCMIYLGIFFFVVFFTMNKIEAATYENNSGVGFYGEYIFPDEEHPFVKPDSNTEGKSSLGDLPSGPKNQGKVLVGSRKLPQTGLKNTNQIGTGIFLIIMMCLIVIKNKKNKKGIINMKYTKLVGKSTLALALLGLGSPSVSVLAADGGTYQSNGSVEFVPNTDPVNPVDPEDPNPEKPVKPIDPTNPEGPNPGTNGPLSIDYASSLDFGQNKITNTDQTYYAKAQEFSEGHIAGEYRGNYVQITDNRGTIGGWTLTLKQEDQLKSETAKKYKELIGAQISLTNSVAETISENVVSPIVTDVKLDPAGASTVIMAANEGSGAGTWVDRFGNAEEMTVDGKNVQKNKAVTLTIPGKTPKEAVKYTTKLTWTLTDVPGNTSL